MSSAGKLLIASALAAVFATACTSTQIAPVSYTHLRAHET